MQVGGRMSRTESHVGFPRRCPIFSNYYVGRVGKPCDSKTHSHVGKVASAFVLSRPGGAVARARSWRQSWQGHGLGGI